MSVVATTRVFRILSVDDNAEILHTVDKVLARVGMQTTCANGGEQALAMLEHNSFDLVLLDEQMPGMRGLEVCRRLKADPRWRAIPVIFLTANQSEAFRMETQRVGAVGLLPKPFDMLSLLTAVLTALNQPPPAGATLTDVLRDYAPRPTT